MEFHSIGPWIRQHDPEFRTDGKISIFNNNAYHYDYVNDQARLDVPRETNIMTIDPKTRDVEVVYGSREGQEMFSVVRGSHELLEGGNILISEFDAGRVLEVTPEGEVVWEYVNKVDDATVGEITNSEVYPEGYFETDMGACN